MKKLLLLFIPVFTFAQANTEIHLFDINLKNNEWVISNGKNISNNRGYDNQPHFYDDNTVLFSSTRNKQTDIIKYDISLDKLTYVSNTPNGGEYSPQRIPNSKHLSAVRLDKDGKQGFYAYNFNTGKYKELIQDLVVAYPLWYDQNTLISSAIVNDSLQLNISSITPQKNIGLIKNVGRSFHKIPNSNLISFMKKNGQEWEVWSLHPRTKATKFIVNVQENQDVCWLPNGELLFPHKNRIYKYNPETKESPSIFYAFTNEEINNISRITVNENGTKLAFAAEESPRHIVQKQLEAYNNRDIEAFMATFSKDVKVYTHLDQLKYQGKDKMRNIYEPMFNTVKNLHCKIITRIVKDNKVIDEESITIDGKKFRTVANYEVTNGRISAIRFLRK